MLVRNKITKSCIERIKKRIKRGREIERGREGGKIPPVSPVGDADEGNIFLRATLTKKRRTHTQQTIPYEGSESTKLTITFQITDGMRGGWDHKSN